MKAFNKLIHPKKAYHIKTKKIEDSEEEERISKEALELFKSLMSQKEAYQSFASIEDSIFLFISENKAMRVIELLQANDVLVSYKEVTTDVLMDSLCSEEFNKTFIEKDEFKHVLNRFIIENLSVDIVLDKINEQGIGALSELDYEVLMA